MGTKLNKDTLNSVFCGYELFLSEGRERGFTIVELIIAMAVASVVAMSGYALFSQSNWSYQVQENVGEAQQNARVAMDRMVRDIRTAGFGLPKPPYDLSFNVSGTPSFESPITVSDNSTGPDTITILGIGYEAGKLVGTNENKKAAEFICYSSTVSSGDKIIEANKALVSRKHVSIDGVFFATLDTGETSGGCGAGSGVQLHLDSPSKLKGNLKDGTVYVIQAVEYSIVNTNGEIDGCSQANPCLVSKDYSDLRGADRQLLAENIEDIQFAYGLDEGKGKIYDEATSYTAASFVDTTTEESSIRAVRITLAARTRNKDSKGATFKRPAIENHPESASDNYRRRVLTKVVKLRN
jgi:prepilin-type N-terminal cleavage/methylation domain-containing protein